VCGKELESQRCGEKSARKRYDSDQLVWGSHSWCFSAHKHDRLKTGCVCLDVILACLKQFVGLERHEIFLVRCATKATNCRIKLHLVMYAGYRRYGTGKAYLRPEAYLRCEAYTWGMCTTRSCERRCLREGFLHGMHVRVGDMASDWIRMRRVREGLRNGLPCELFS
jgi:hypothetical protein